MFPYSKYHALGNDYLVIEPSGLPAPLNPAAIRAICQRNTGLGSDGILLGPLSTPQANFGLRIFNPDGSEAEKSGNGLRIFSRWLWDHGLVSTQPFSIETPGGIVQAVVLQGGQSVRVEMGKVSFWSDEIPVQSGRSERHEVLNEALPLAGETFTFCAATIGNPHCVLPLPEVSAELAHRLGPQIEIHPFFPRRTNVQFMQVLDRKNIRIEIWERGAGYTLASGSSSSAAAAVAQRLGLCDERICVHMPGGQLLIEIGSDSCITMTGPVRRVAEGLADWDEIMDGAA